MALKQIAATALTASDSTAKEEPGQIRVEATGKQYRYVRNCSSKTLVKGNAVNFHLASGVYYQVHCSRPTTDTVRCGGKNAPAGILVGSIKKGNYGWAQIKGNFLGTTLRMGNGPGLTGSMFGLRCGQTTRVQALSGCAARALTVSMGVIIGTGSTTFCKGVLLNGAF